MPIVDKSQRIETDYWLFDKPINCNKNIKGRRYANQWHRKVGFLQASPYKQIAECKLPAIRPSSHLGPDGCKNSIYTRFTRRQHKKKDEIQTLMQIIDSPKGLYNELSRSVAKNRRQQLEHVVGEFPQRSGQLPVDMTSKMYEQLKDVLSEKGDPHLPQEHRRSKASGRDTGEERLKIRRKTLQNVEESLHTVPNPYHYMAKKEKERNKGLSKKAATKKKEEEEHPWGSPEEHHIKAVAQDFCEWVFDIGGEQDNIDESTLTCLFSGGYDTKPDLSMPVQVVKKCDIPPELVEDVPLLEAHSSKHSSLIINSTSKSNQAAKGRYQPFRYGAWYLDPKTWRKMDPQEPLEDPNQLKEGELSEAEIRRQELNEELSTYFIPGAFMEFLRQKRARIPQFLLDVAEIQREMREKEKQDEEEMRIRKQSLEA